MSISDGSILAVLSSPDSDLGLVGYEMALLVERAGRVLTPALRAELQSALPR
jgi:predicted regulator of Ras-like GTPase activity (Roadblock/LC7/MglB family)